MITDPLINPKVFIQNKWLNNNFNKTNLVSLAEVFVNSRKTTPITEHDSEIIILLNALSLSACLFPDETKIELTVVKCDQLTENYEETFENIQTISQLKGFIRYVGQENICEFQFGLCETGVGVWHNGKNQLIVVGIKGKDKLAFIERVMSL